MVALSRKAVKYQTKRSSVPQRVSCSQKQARSDNTADPAIALSATAEALEAAVYEIIAICLQRNIKLQSMDEKTPHTCF